MALRGIKNVVGNYTNGEIKVREATTNEAWGPTTAQLAEISDICYQLLQFHEVMSMIEKRLNDKGKNYRHVAKALLVLDYVIKTGPERVIQYWKDKLYIINTLKDFQFTDKEAKDQGRLIRDRAKQITLLLNDNDLLLVEREKALETKKKFHSSDLAPTSSSDPTSRSWEPDRKPFQSQGTKTVSQPGSTPNLSADIKAALPSNRGEEDLQLQLALALSKEDSDTKTIRTGDEESQLKSVIQQSRNESEQRLTPGMIAPPPGSRTAAEPWRSLPEPSQPKSTEELGDPWGGSGGADPLSGQNLVLEDQQDVSDPWMGELRGRLDSPPQEADPWGDMTSARNGSPALKPVNLTNEIVMGPDPWGALNKKGEPGDVGLLDRPISPPKDTITPLLPGAAVQQGGGVSTIEAGFLGQNAKLVNLDALVDLGRAPATGSGQEGNPFAMLPPDTSTKPVSNPFLSNVSPRPTLNQMRDTSKPDPLQAPLIPSASAGPPVPSFSTLPPSQPQIPGTAQSSHTSELASVFQNPTPPYSSSLFPTAAAPPQIGQVRPGPDYSVLQTQQTGFSTAPTGPYSGFSLAPNQPPPGFQNFSTGQAPVALPGSAANTGYSLQGVPGFNTGLSAGAPAGVPGVSAHNYGGNPSFPQSSNPFF